MTDHTLSLYFELKKNENADLEVIAAAALQWVATLRAASEIINPDVQLRVEIIDAEEGSLRLNTVLDWIESELDRVKRGSGKHPNLRALAIGIVVFLTTVGVNQFISGFDAPNIATLAEEDRDRIDELTKILGSHPSIEAEQRKFFRIIERDPSISAVGVSGGRDKPPVILIPSGDFARRSGLWTIEDDEQERTLRPIVDVKLVSPMLVPKPRSWRFKPEGLPEFNAIMKDAKFLEALKEDRLKETLRIGIPMTVRLKVVEKKVDGNWVMKRGGRSVVEVISPKID